MGTRCRKVPKPEAVWLRARPVVDATGRVPPAERPVQHSPCSRPALRHRLCGSRL